MTKVLADALVPIFAGLLLGYFAGLWRRMDNQNVRTLITFVMSFVRDADQRHALWFLRSCVWPGL
jgi:hypothetical protein